MKGEEGAMSTRHGLGTVLLAAVLLVSSCVSGDPDVFIIKVASSAPADEPGSRALQRFVDVLNEAAPGRVEARLFAAAALGNESSQRRV